MNNNIRYELDLNHLPPLTLAQQAELRALAATPEAAIDTSDIPPLDNAFWENGMNNPFYKPTKTATTVRVDSDVLAWLKSQGGGYQTRLNAILRAAMVSAIQSKPKSS